MKSAVAVLAVTMGMLSAEAAVFTWNPNGSGGWKDATRWSEGAAPKAGDRVNIIHGAHALMTEADAELAASLSDIVLYDESELEINVMSTETPLTYASDNISGQNAAHNGGGRVVKTGPGKLIYGKSSGASASYRVGNPSKGFRIENGEMFFMGNAGPIEVLAPGSIRPREDNTFACYGLSGDGTVVSDVWKEFSFAGGSAASPSVFSGTFVGTIDLTLNNGYQYLTNPAMSDQNVDLRFYTGVLGVSKVGPSGVASSIGKGNTVWFRGTPTRLVYLGTGETTDKYMKMFKTENVGMILDGGATGGLVFSSDIYGSDSAARMCVLTLDGSNSVPCVIMREIRENAQFATYVLKQGCGIWEMGSTAIGGHGAYAVENGILRFNTIAEAGTSCSLGFADRLFEPYVGTTVDESKRVSYAYLLGDGTPFAAGMDLRTNSATLEYVGSAAAVCKTRSVALKGAGRLRNGTSNTFHLEGVTSFSDADNALVLDAAGDGNEVRNVTNGVGRITVVKEGTGTFNMGGDLDFSGVEVRAGTLRIKTVDAFTYFRFRAKETYNAETGSQESNYQLAQFCLWDADGNMRSENLRYRNCVGDATKLLPGEVTDLRAFASTGNCAYNPRGKRYVDNLFTNDVAITKNVRDTKDVIWSGGSGRTPSLTDETSWAGFLCRLPEGSMVTRYDMYCAGAYRGRNVKSWTLEGSRDGVNWTMLHNVITNPTPVSAGWRWFSDGKDTHVADGGYPITTTTAHKTFSAPISVCVNEGAMLITESPVVVNEIVYDYAQGGGSLDGLAFAEKGTFRLVNAPTKLLKADLPMTFGENIVGLENVANWQVVVNGVPAARKSVSLTTDGFQLLPCGVFMIFH